MNILTISRKIVAPFRLLNDDVAYKATLTLLLVMMLLSVAGYAGIFDRPNERMSSAISTTEIPALLKSASIVKIEGVSRFGNGSGLEVTRQDGQKWTWDSRANPTSARYEIRVKDGQTVYYGEGPNSLQSKEDFFAPIVQDIKLAKARIDRYTLQEVKAEASWK